VNTSDPIVTISYVELNIILSAFDSMSIINRGKEQDISTVNTDVGPLFCKNMHLGATQNMMSTSETETIRK
jgi:hypothetical protein